MSHENAKILYQAAQDAQQKFEYFLTGAIGAMFAYTAQTYTPKKLDWTTSALEPVAIICFAVAFFLGIMRLDCLYHHLGISSQQAQAEGDSKEIEKALRVIEADPLLRTPWSGNNPLQIEEELRRSRSRAESAKPILAKLDGKIYSYYTWRNRLMVAGFSLIVVAKVATPYLDTTQPLTKQTDRKASEPQELTTKVQPISSSPKK